MSASYSWKPVKPEQRIAFKEYLSSSVWEKLSKVFHYTETVNNIALSEDDILKLETLYDLEEDEVYHELIELIRNNGTIEIKRSY